jgi:uncharacterized protein YndB with AHSA1/START domain
MTQSPDILSEKTVHVPLTAAEAFSLFTEGMASWWPKGGPQLRMDPRKGGDITELDSEGRPVKRGKIIAFDPDGFLAFTWHPRDMPDAATIVTVAFVATATGCRVVLTQGSESILGAVADAVSTSYLRDWGLVLGSYCTCAGRVSIAA